MAVRPICEPVELALGASVLAERVVVPGDAPAMGGLLHFHDVCELVLFERVSGAFFADGRRYPLGDGSLIFAPSMRHHDFALEPGAKAWVLVHIDPYVVERLALQPELGRLTRAFCATPGAPDAARIASLADWLIEVGAADPLGPLARRIVELLLIAAAGAPETEGGEAADDAAHVERLLPATERLRRDPGAPPTLEEAASACGLSPAYFSRRFKRVFGMNFTDYARIYRLHLAARRIATTGASVSEIAYGLGFSSPSHFTARFHQRFGMTPREYRGGVRERRP